MSFPTARIKGQRDDLIRHNGNVLNTTQLGKLNCTGSVTLVTSAATTTVTDTRIGDASVIDFMPTTANAAGEIATMYVSSRDPDNNQFVITHANNAQADRTFAYSIIG